MISVAVCALIAALWTYAQGLWSPAAPPPSQPSATSEPHVGNGGDLSLEAKVSSYFRRAVDVYDIRHIKFSAYPAADLSVARYRMNESAAVGIFESSGNSVDLLLSLSAEVDQVSVVALEQDEFLYVRLAGGTGGLTDLALYEWKGVGPFREVANINTLTRKGLFDAEIFQVGGRLLVRSHSLRFEIARSKGRFYAKRYAEHPTVPWFANDRVLRVRSRNAYADGEPQRVLLDGKLQREDATIVLRIGSRLLIDDLELEPLFELDVGAQTRLNYCEVDGVPVNPDTSDRPCPLQWREGFFDHLIAVRPGIAKLGGCRAGVGFGEDCKERSLVTLKVVEDGPPS